MNVDEFTENTNTGILHPARDHSFENVKNLLKNIKRMLINGPLIFTLVAFSFFWGSFLSLEMWPVTYSSQIPLQFTQNAPQNFIKSTQSHVFLEMLLQEKPVLTALKNNQSFHKNQNVFSKALNKIPAILMPASSYVVLAHLPQNQMPKQRLQAAFRLIKKRNNLYVLNISESSIPLANALKKSFPKVLNQFFQKRSLNVKVTSPLSKNTHFLATTYFKSKNAIFNISLLIGGFIALLLTYNITSSKEFEPHVELNMTFPFPVLGMLPEKSHQSSPTILNDAYELLRTNVSMQRSIFSFSSLTLIWPFEESEKNEFLTRMASDYSKTTKKVLIIETNPLQDQKNPLFGSSQNLGLTDFHKIIQNSPEQSDNENTIFWKLYEYVVGTEEKFHYMPYGKAQIAPEVLFEKYNFRKILNLLKKHFSLVIFNVPEHIDTKKPLPWTTVSDATLIIANYQRHNSVTSKDYLKEIACHQRFLLGGVLTNVPIDIAPAKILSYRDLKAIRHVA